jgi:DivIVA domain-containing protein
MPKSRTGLTVDDVRSVLFSSPPVGKRGYNRDDVDALLRQIEERLESRNDLSAEDVRTAVFHKPPLFRRGYHEDQVDEFLDRAVVAIQALESGRR